MVEEFRSQQIKEKPVYEYDKNRTDARQMPINFYIKNRDELK